MTSGAAVLVPLPDRDFDVTEVAVPWKLCAEAGVEVVFATEEGATPAADPLLIDGVVLGRLGARPEPIQFYRQLEASDAFRRPQRWREVDASRFAALLLPGGHAPGMRQYLESEAVRSLIAAFWHSDRPVAAICHGVLAVARTARAVRPRHPRRRRPGVRGRGRPLSVGSLAGRRLPVRPPAHRPARGQRGFWLSSAQ